MTDPHQLGSKLGAMSGKVCLITGGTGGIGRAAAIELARLGARVVIVGRDPGRCDAAAREIAQSGGDGPVEYLCADLSSQEQVRQLAADFKRRIGRLDVLINNAGALFALRRESVDGIEMTLALNHLAYFLLTGLLLDTILASAPARIINISSAAHADVKQFDIDDPQATGRRRGPRYGRSESASLLYCLTMPWAHPGFVQYAQSKLANLLFTFELARRLEGTGITVNAVHPGFIASSFSAGNGALGWFMRRWAQVLGKTAEQGARTPVYLAASPEVQATSGGYFVRCKQKEPSPASKDAHAAARLWALSEQLTGCLIQSRA
jgi:retinol dehydrogenase-12